MCLQTMDSKTKRVETDYRDATTSPGANLGWGLIHVSATGNDEALKRCRVTSWRLNIRKYLRRARRRTQLAKSPRILGRTCAKGSVREPADDDRLPPGAMAPENTTQYLMSNAYEDMKSNNAQADEPATCAHVYDEYLSASSAYAALDCGYESCLAFQQRDFESLYDSW